MNITNKEKIIFIVVGILAIVVLLSVILIKPATKNGLTPIPVLVAPSAKPTTPFISYNESKRNQLVDIMKNRPKIPDQDQTLRASLISNLGNRSGILLQTKDYIIKYVKAPNIFQVQILTSDYLSVKQQATKWFKDQGFSTEGICKLPIQFYLSAEVKANLQESLENFNYLPEGCQ